MFHYLHRMGFDSEFKTLFQAMRQVVADLGKWKNDRFKNSTLFVLQNCQGQVIAARKALSLCWNLLVLCIDYTNCISINTEQ